MTYDIIRSDPTHLKIDMPQISNQQYQGGVGTYPAEYTMYDKITLATSKKKSRYERKITWELEIGTLERGLYKFIKRFQ